MAVTSYGLKGSENGITFLPEGFVAGESEFAVVVCHGNNELAVDALTSNQAPLLRSVADTYPVVEHDLTGKVHWGNEAAMSKLVESVDYARNVIGADRVFLWGISMGTLPAVLFTVRYPGLVAGLALTVPLVDLALEHDFNVGGFAAQIETALGITGTYNGLAAIEARQPISLTDELRATSVPIKVWYASNDGLAPTARAKDFIAATGALSKNGGAVGHSYTATLAGELEAFFAQVIAGETIPAGRYDVTLGRIKLPTTLTSLKESLGGTLETVGAVAMPGEPRPRPFAVTIPVHGDRERDPHATGDRLRRQVRSLIENDDARNGGTWFRFGADPDLDAALLIGGAELAYAEDSGPTFGEYQLDLSECYRIANRRRHRQAFRLEVADRRLSTTPRDYLRRLYSTDFAAISGLALAFVPPGATDIRAGTSGAAATSKRSGGDGLAAVIAAAAGTVVTYEQDDTLFGDGDGVILDRRGVTTPTLTSAGDLDPQAGYGWEEVYGPDYPLTSGDVPTLQNGLCRTRYIDAQKAIAVDTYDSITKTYVEQGRVTFWRCDAVPSAGSVYQYGTSQLTSAEAPVVTVMEWTHDRAVIKVVFAHHDAPAADRGEIYVTLQRGWTAPRVELYPYQASGTPGAAIRWTPNTTGTMAATKGAVNLAADSAVTGFGGGDHGDFTGSDPFAAVVREDNTQRVAVLSVLQLAARLVTRNNCTAAYGGAGRFSAEIACPAGGAAAGYCSATLGFPSEQAAIYEAETGSRSGTTTAVADAAAVAGNAVKDTSTNVALSSISFSAATLNLTIGLGTFQAWARVRCENAASTCQFAAAFSDGVTVSVSPIRPSTSNAYAWIYLGDITRSLPAQQILFYAARSAGTGGAMIDRVLLLPNGSLGDYTGALELAQTNLIDVQQLRTFVDR